MNYKTMLIKVGLIAIGMMLGKQASALIRNTTGINIYV